MSALERDGWSLDTTKGSIRTYKKGEGKDARRVQVHFHGNNEGWGPKLLKKILSNIGWDEGDLKRLKLIR